MNSADNLCPCCGCIECCRDDQKCTNPAMHEKYSERGIEDQCPHCPRSPSDYGVE